ncbi:MAG: hypothetical protein IT445_00130 [Phycisphaeraceae bacterium]|nr:hypothetical protein [Phycisphaeraceae bacterium]
MAWTGKYKQIFARACAAIGLTDEQRHMVLSSLPNAHCPRKGCVTSTARKLNPGDFEQAMATVESMCPSQRVKLPATRNKALFYYSIGYWQRKAADECSRMRRLVWSLHQELVDQHAMRPDSLPGMVRRTAEDNRTDDIEQLGYVEVSNLIEALKAIARRNGVRIDHLLRHPTANSLLPTVQQTARTPHAHSHPTS